VDIDLMPVCKDACVYQIDFTATEGKSPLEIQSLQYFFDGTAMPDFLRKAGMDGTRYHLTVTGLGKPLKLRAVVRVAGEKKDSQGTASIIPLAKTADKSTATKQ